MRCIGLGPPTDLTRYFSQMRRAREIDPAAWRPIMVPRFSGEQISRQSAAMAQAAEELEREDA